MTFCPSISLCSTVKKTCRLWRSLMMTMAWPAASNHKLVFGGVLTLYESCPWFKMLFYLSKVHIALFSAFLSCPSCPALNILSRLSCSECPVLVVLSWQSCASSAVLFCLECNGHSVRYGTAIPFWLSCYACPVLAVPFSLSFSGCHLLSVLSWQYYICNIVIVLAVLCWQPCPDSPVLAILFCLCCSVCSVCSILAVLS